MDKKSYYALGTIFVVASGFIYAIERGISYYTWIGQMMSASHTGSSPINPQLPGLLTNIYIPGFVIIGAIFYVLGCGKK